MFPPLCIVSTSLPSHTCLQKMRQDLAERVKVTKTVADITKVLSVPHHHAALLRD